jgi:UDP-N-acetylmuramoyl-tripeptide--D-alanyl-D-alanine ligase
MAAIAIGKHFTLNASEINEGITSYIPGNNRSQITKTASNTLICDYYNANPSSMNAALDNFASISANKKVIILGDMFELGEDSLAEHKLILEKALQVKCELKLFIGKNFFYSKTNDAQFFETLSEASQYIKANPIQNATILVKGSRSMFLEKLVEIL